MFTWVVISLAAGTMLLLAIAMSFILGWANQAFHVEVDPKIIQVNDVLPGANCGGCGYVGCNEYAEAVVLNGESVSKCPVGGASCAEAVAAVMGVEVEQSWPYKAVIHCGADFDQRKGRMDYVGEKTCSAANVISGIQGCTYGCLGFGDCVVACTFDAMLLKNGLPEVIYDKCTGCGACAAACPRNIITMVPFKAERIMVVACCNKDFGGEVKAVCEVGCIGCKACTKVNDLLEMDGNLPVLNYDVYDPAATDFSDALHKCPMDSLVFVGTPTEADKQAVADEEIPDRVEADFKTTADEAEWRG